MAKTAWYQTGNAGEKRAQAEDEKAKARRDNQPWSFRLKADEEAKIVWLDTPKFYCSLHTLKVGRSFVTETCVQDFDTCPPCESGNNPSYVLVGTVIDTRSFEGKSGTVKNQKRLFIAKAKARQILLRRIKDAGGDIRFCLFQMARGSNVNECATGEDFVNKGRVSETKVRALCPSGEKVDEWIKPFDYVKVFQPKTSAELRKLYGGEEPVGSEDDASADDGVDDLLDDTPEEKGDLDLDDDLLESTEEKAPAFDETALKKELSGLARAKGLEGLKALKKYCNDNGIEIKITSKSKKTEVVREIIEAMRPEEGAEEPEAVVEEEIDDLDKDIDIDDLI